MKNKLLLIQSCIITFIVLIASRETSHSQTRVQYYSEENLTYRVSRPMMNESKPIAVHAIFAENFEHHNYSNWEVVFDDGTQTQTLAGEGEQQFMKLQHERMYQDWYQLQIELWEGPLPKDGYDRQDPRWNQYLENFYYKYVWIPWYDKVAWGLNVFDDQVQQLQLAQPLATSTLEFIHARGSFENSHWNIRFHDGVTKYKVPMGVGEAHLQSVRRTADFASMHIDGLIEAGDPSKLGYGGSHVSTQEQSELRMNSTTPEIVEENTP